MTAAALPGDHHARPTIETRADFDLWLDGYEAGTATTLRTLADVPAAMLPAVVAGMRTAQPTTTGRCLGGCHEGRKTQAI